MAVSPLLAHARLARSASLDQYLNATLLVGPANAAVPFDNGISGGTYPTVLLNTPGNGVFGASQPHQLELDTAPWGFTSIMMASSTPPIGTHPLFGFNSVEGQIYKLEILPPGSYPIYLSASNPANGPTYVNFSRPVLQIYAGNHNGAQSVFSNWIALIPSIYDGAVHLIQAFLNPDGATVGSTPFSLRVFVDNVEVNVYSSTGQNPRALNGVFNIPWGPDRGYPAPSSWVGFDYPIYGGDRGMAWSQQNSFNGMMDHLYFDAAAPVDPSQAVYQFATQSGYINILSRDGSNVLYPGQAPPAIYLHGDASPTGFKFNHGIVRVGDTLSIDTTYGPQEGYVDIEDIHIGFDTIGAPPSGDP